MGRGRKFTRSLDPEVFLLELRTLHFLLHPARCRTAPGPGDRRVFLAAKLRRDLAALERLATLAARAARLTLSAVAAQRRKLALQIIGAAREYLANLIAHFQKSIDRHRS